MSNIKQHIVPYPVAKWMIQKGFNEPCVAGDIPSVMLAPLWQQAIVWFQEQFNIAIETYYDPVLQGWAYKLYSTDTFETLDNVSAYETWYLCVEDAIEKCINIIDKICE